MGKKKQRGSDGWKVVDYPTPTVWGSAADHRLPINKHKNEQQVLCRGRQEG